MQKEEKKTLTSALRILRFSALRLIILQKKEFTKILYILIVLKSKKDILKKIFKLLQTLKI